MRLLQYYASFACYHLHLHITIHKLQVLLYSALFLLLMLEQDPSKLPDTEVANELRTRQTTQALRTILAQMVNESSKQSESRIPISAEPIQGALTSPFSGGRSQEDAEEFLTSLLNAVSDSFSGNFGGLPPLQPQAWRNPAACMRGSTVQTCKCLTCKISSSPAETQFFTLRIPLPEGGAKASISDLVLDECSREEQLTGDNMYDCSNCPIKTDGLKENWIETPPEILVLHLKRFKFSVDSGQTAKTMTPVDIENKITLYCSNGETASYSLFSTVMHEGSGPNNGHYFSICRCSGCAASEDIFSSSRPIADSDQPEWRILDDTNVSEQMTLSACLAEAMGRHVNATPYIAFYALRSSTACPVCCDNGSRLKELAQKVALPSPPLGPPPPAPPSQPLPPVSEQAIADCIRSYMTTRTRVRITEVI